jgi:hypothetical protein
MSERDTLVWVLGILDGQQRYENGDIVIDMNTRELIIDKILDILRSGDLNAN